MFVNPFPSVSINIAKKPDNKPSVLHFYADVSGCSLYRLRMPGHLLMYNGRANIQTLNRMILDPRFYETVDAVRIQRQVTPQQLKYIEFLKETQRKYDFRIIYEIDDIPYFDDIPEYNVARSAYQPADIQTSITKILNLVDEMTVTNQFMKKYFQEKKGIKNVTVIPNFPAKFWMGNMYNQDKINRNYNDNKNKPRILYCGSKAHYNIGNNKNIKDDLDGVVDAIINTINEYQWVFLGGFPRKLQPYIEHRKIEYHPWSPLTQYPYKLYNLNVQAAIAPLLDNTFNRAKSDLKWYEMCAYGIPCVCQNLCTYENAWWKFDTGDEMINHIDNIVHNKHKYRELGRQLYNEADKRWLDNPQNIGCYEELYRYPYDSLNRNLLKKYN